MTNESDNKSESQWVVLKADGSGRMEITDHFGSFFMYLSPPESDDTSSCTHIYKYYNGANWWDNEEDDDYHFHDYIHVCSLTDFIDDLIEIKELSEKYRRGEDVVIGCDHVVMQRYKNGTGICQCCGKDSSVPYRPIKNKPPIEKVEDVIDAMQNPDSPFRDRDEPPESLEEIEYPDDRPRSLEIKHGRNVAESFYRYANQWRKETYMSSDVRNMVLNGNYQKIIGLGKAVLPLIYEEMKKHVDHWFWALYAIVGEDMAKGEDTVQGAHDKWMIYLSERFGE